MSTPMPEQLLPFVEQLTHEQQLEAAWAAGFFDGEGTTHITVSARGNNSYTYVRLSISQVGRAALDRFSAATGGGTINGPLARERPEWSPIHTLTASGPVAGKALARMWPFLCEPKRLQAAAAFRKARLGGGRGINFSSRTHCPHGHPFSPENTYPRGKNGRGCIACRLAHHARLKDKYNANRRAKKAADRLAGVFHGSPSPARRDGGYPI